MADSQVGRAGRTAKADPNHNLQELLLAKREPRIMGVRKEVLAVFPLMFLMISVRPEIISIPEKSMVLSFRKRFNPVPGQSSIS